MKEVIEKMKEAISEAWNNPPEGKKQTWGQFIEYATQASLDLRYDCKECGGRGKTCKHLSGDCSCVCYFCNGTGKGLPMLAIVSEDQELPMNPFTLKDNIGAWYKQAQQDMLNAGFRRVER